MNDTTRRRFLQGAAAGGLAAVTPLGCGRTPGEAQEEAAENKAVADDSTVMSIAKWNDTAAPADDLKAIAEQVTTEAIAGMGGMKRFVKQGDTVWIKPNIAIRAVEVFAANTNPHVVATLCTLALEAGAAKVQVGDTAAYGATQTYPLSGIQAAVEAAGGEMLVLDDSHYTERELGGEFLEKWGMCDPMMNADLLINVPIAKHHALTGVSLAMKNLMGVAQGYKNDWHQNIDTCLSDVSAYVQPRLNVLDAIRALVRHGPKGGDMKDVEFKGIVAASTDIVALDAAGAELIGFQPTRVRSITTGHKRGLGEINFRKLNPVQRVVG